MGYLKRILILTFTTLLTFQSNGQSSREEVDKIQIAFLLDVSGSMDQLILKAKSQFWRISTYLGTATRKGKKPTVEFAVMIYGLDFEEDLSKVLTDFNSDLDSVAMNLHEINIIGSTEHCWTTIDKALSLLTWSKEKKDLKLLVIAGNESFNQEEYNSKKVIDKARKMGVIINTIYCGVIDKDPTSIEWRNAAEQANGNHFSISLNDSLNLKENFLDKKLSDFNDKFNATYVPFGPRGQESHSRMILQDENSRMAGAPFFRERIVYKASESFKNPAWDLVDAIEVDSTIILNEEFLKETKLDYSILDNFKEFISNKQNMRDSYKEVIKLRYEMIKKYLGENAGDKDLDIVIRKIIDKEGRRRGFEFKAQ